MSLAPSTRLFCLLGALVAGACRAPRAAPRSDAGAATAAAPRLDGGQNMASPRFRLQATQGRWAHTVAPPAPSAADAGAL